jgi:hypothetical protein
VMIPELKRFQSKIDGPGGLRAWLTLARGINNPWCVVKSKTYVKHFKRVVAKMETVTDSFGKAKKVPVIRNYVKKAAFLETFASKIVELEGYLDEKCNSFNLFRTEKLEKIIKGLSKARLVLLVITTFTLPFYETRVCGLNNLLAAIAVELGAALIPDRKLGGTSEVELDMNVTVVFDRVLEQVEDPTIKSAMLQILNMNADRLAGKTVLDFFQESLDEDDDPLARRHLSMANMTELAGRFLSFNSELVDVTSLKGAVDAIKEVNDVFCVLDDKLTSVYDSVVDPAIKFVDELVKPFESIADILEPFQPVIDVMEVIANAISFLQCPSVLGFICDLGK